MPCLLFVGVMVSLALLNGLNEIGDFVSPAVIQQEPCALFSTQHAKQPGVIDFVFSTDTHTFAMVHCSTAERTCHGSICLTKCVCVCVGTL